MQPTNTSEYLASQGLFETFPQTFLRRVDQSGPVPEHQKQLGNCWTWCGHKLKSGYGNLTAFRRGFRKSRTVLAHRVSWIIHRGAILEGLNVLHKCDNPSCVNPDHLFLGTTMDNIRDKYAKGRARVGCGERHRSAVLTWEKVRTIRALHASGISQVELCRVFKVKDNTMSVLINRLTWKNDPHG